MPKITLDKFWHSIKWSNRNPDGSITISPERAKSIDEVVKNETVKG